MRRIVTAALIAALALLTACTGRFHTDAPMERFRFLHSGMSTGDIYTLTAEKTDEGWEAAFDLFCTHEFRLPMTQEDADALAAIIDSQDLWAWNGFDKAPRNVKDGSGFDLHIRFADGQKLSASGENAFPDGYAAAESAILEYFIHLMEKNGMTNPF